MTLNKISKSVACTFFLQTQPARQATLPGLSRGKASCFLHAEHGVFLFGSINSRAFQTHGGKTSPLMTSLLFLTHHRQPSRGPVEASRLLSVSEASVCSVDMDEMSLIDDDWEGVAWLLTAASVLRKPNIIKPEARHCCESRQWYCRPLLLWKVSHQNILNFSWSLSLGLASQIFLCLPLQHFPFLPTG